MFLHKYFMEGKKARNSKMKFPTAMFILVVVIVSFDCLFQLIFLWQLIFFPGLSPLQKTSKQSIFADTSTSAAALLLFKNAVRFITFIEVFVEI